MGCYDCGLEYGGDGWIETLLPKKIWNKIRPENTAEGGGILCITCICRRLKKMNLDRVPIFICGTEPIVVLPNMAYGDLEKFIFHNWDVE